MLRVELAEILRNGENSGIEFKRDDALAEKVAKEIAALLNLRGGRLILGVEDDGTVTGLTRTPSEAESWIMNLCRQNIQPALIPFWETIAWDDGKVVAVVSLPDHAPDRPYKAKRGGHWLTHIRVGTTSREATREEEARLYQASGMIRYELRPVPGATLADLDLRRLTEYFARVRNQDAPASSDVPEWESLLVNTEIMVEVDSRPVPTIAAMLLFGLSPKKWLPQSGVTATSWVSTEKDYSTRERETIRGPLVRLSSDAGIIETGIIERALSFITRNTAPRAELSEGIRVERWPFPDSAVREAVVNAVVHRDYTMVGTDIELNVFPDRLEIISPGALPNTITVDRMRAGCRAARNELIREVLGDYDYVDARGLGVPRKIIYGMKAHNGTAPDLIEEETRFIVRLFSGQQRE
jgi:ATP-dependent DNA helicase RecG